MKGAKELAEHCREEAARQFGYFGAEEHRSFLSDIAAHLDAKAAIDSAVPGEVREIANHHDHCFIRGAKEPEDSPLLSWYRAAKIADAHRGSLLVIIQRGAVALRQTIRDELLEAARVEVERLKAALQAHNPGLRAALSREESAHLATLAELDEARVKAAALAQENARLINEVGELHAKLAAPSVDMTPGMQPRQPLSATEELPVWRKELGRLRNMRGSCATNEDWVSRDRVWLGCNARLEALERLEALRRVILSSKGEAVIPEGMTKFMPIEGGGYYPAGLWEPCGVYADWRLVDQENGIYTADKAWLLLAIDSYANSLINP